MSSYVKIVLLLLALFLLVRMMQNSTQTTTTQPPLNLTAAGPAARDVGPKNAILVHPLDTLIPQPAEVGVWNGASAPVVGKTSVGPPAPVNMVGGQIATANANGSVLGTAAEGLAVQPVDYDTIFNKQNVSPADLIPKVDPELYPGAANLNQNFMVNEIQSGLSTSSRRKYISDIRPIYPNPITVTTPFGNPTSFPDVTRRSVCDL